MSQKSDPELDDKISVLYQTGYSTYQIADRLDIERDRVRTSLKRTNTPRRSISDGMKLRRAMA